MSVQETGIYTIADAATQKTFRINATELKARIDSVEYTWYGGYGAVLQSHERGIKRGDVRMIGNIVFFAYQVSNAGWTREVSWCPQQDIDGEWLRRFKAAVFDC